MAKVGLAKVGFDRVDQRTKLRSQECPRIWRRSYYQSDRKSVESGHHTICAFFERCGDGPVTIIFDGVDDRGVGRQEKVGAGGFSSFGSAIDGGEPSVRVRHGFRGVRVGEASNPGPAERVRP